MVKHHNKLVREHSVKRSYRIPEIIEAAGRQCAIAQMTAGEYQQALREKLVEEAQEAAIALPDELIRELADLYEVVDALMVAYQIERSDVVREQEARRAERGGFGQQLRLLWSEAE